MTKKNELKIVDGPRMGEKSAKSSFFDFVDIPPFERHPSPLFQTSTLSREETKRLIREVYEQAAPGCTPPESDIKSLATRMQGITEEVARVRDSMTLMDLQERGLLTASQAITAAGYNIDLEEESRLLLKDWEKLLDENSPKIKLHSCSVGTEKSYEHWYTTFQKEKVQFHTTGAEGAYNLTSTNNTGETSREGDLVCCNQNRDSFEGGGLGLAKLFGVHANISPRKDVCILDSLSSMLPEKEAPWSFQSDVVQRSGRISHHEEVIEEVKNRRILEAIKKAHEEWYDEPGTPSLPEGMFPSNPCGEVPLEDVEKDDTDLRISGLAHYLDKIRYVCNLIGPLPRDVYLTTIRLMRARLRCADRYVKGCLEQAEVELQELPSNLPRAEEYEKAREICVPAREGIAQYIDLKKEIIDDEVTYKLLKAEFERMGADFYVAPNKEDFSGEKMISAWRKWHDDPKPV